VLRHVTLKTIAARLGATPAQVALAWVLRQAGVCAIPQSGKPEHVRENRGALDVRLTPHDLADLDETFPPPDRKKPLAVH
jgi:diketogulonate reductase-like aldo/keto reductase